MKRIILAFSLCFCMVTTIHAGEDALAEVNAARAARGLHPLIWDGLLTQGAMRVADHRAAHRIAGHIGGQMSDFALLPPGARADVAGAGALEPWWGWQSCAWDGNWKYAGAAVTVSGGIRYMSIFCRESTGPKVSHNVQRETTVTRWRTIFRRR